MNDKDAIISKIIDNANLKSQEIIKEASLEKVEILKKAREEAKNYRNQILPDINSYINELVSRGEILSNLESKKMILAKKKSIIDDVFKLALQDLKIKENQPIYKKLVEKMIKENSEDGDKIQFSETDKNLFDDKFLQSIAKKIGINLKIDKNYGKFMGGVLISNKNCDKNLTIELELENIRAKIEPKLAKTIFGE